MLLQVLLTPIVQRFGFNMNRERAYKGARDFWLITLKVFHYLLSLCVFVVLERVMTTLFNVNVFRFYVYLLNKNSSFFFIQQISKNATDCGSLLFFIFMIHLSCVASAFLSISLFISKRMSYERHLNGIFLYFS